MTINLHDPRLTAYALGELRDEELAEVETALARSEALRQEVEAIRRTAKEISQALALEEAAELPQEPIDASPPEPTEDRPRWLLFPAGALAVAAAVVLVLALTARNPIEVPPPPQAGELSPPPTERVADADVPPPSRPAPRASMQESRPAERATGGTSRITDVETKSAAAIQVTGVKVKAATAEIASPEPWQTPPPTRTAQSLPLIGPPFVSTLPASAAVRVRGTAKDPGGFVLPGVEVQLRSLTDNSVRTTVTDERGAFSFDLEKSGPLTLTASLAGFKSFFAVFEPNVRESLIDPVLPVGEVSETVTVSASPPRSSPEMAVAGSAGLARRIPAKGTVRMIVADSPLELGRHYDTEAYDRIVDNDFHRVSESPLSTFSIDVDTASYSNVRRFLMDGALPPPDAVRVEELINYFPYDDLPPTGGDPFSVNVEVAEAPWRPDHLLLRIGLKGKAIPPHERPSANLVFLLDVSGSMSDDNKLPLLKRALRLLVEQLQPSDRVSIVVYAGASGLALPPTPGTDKQRILAALDELESGGSTNGGEGIRLAYRMAQENFVPGGINRVILATDGDFNVGVTNQGDLTRLIEEKAKSGVFLSVLGFGMGNYKDSTLEKLADRGNGNYGYVDTIHEARKLLVEQMEGTLITIAKDVKIQVEFNPAHVSGYRLIGYENRRLAAQDFNDDRKDAGEIGAGHSVTALYELIPAGGQVDAAEVDPLKYQRPLQPAPGRHAHELLTVKLRYKKPDEDVSKLIEKAVTDPGTRLADTSDDFRFAAAVAAFGMVLRDSEHKGAAGFDMAFSLAGHALGPDPHGYRNEFVSLVERAREAAAR